MIEPSKDFRFFSAADKANSLSQINHVLELQTLQRKTTESRVYTMDYSKRLVYNLKLQDIKKK